MGSIFISYRREDSQGEALHLAADLKAVFGSDRVFMDVTGIHPGRDFRKVIENAVTTCDALIVMIGDEWIDAVDEEGNRRLDSPRDFVRIETAAALQRDIPVIPVLVQGAAMPRAEKLPADLEALTWRNAFELRHDRWSIDVAELISALRKTVPTLSAGASGETGATPWWRTTSGRAMAGLVVAVLGVTALQQAGVFDRARTVPDETGRTSVAKPFGVQQEPQRQDSPTPQEVTSQAPLREAPGPPQGRISMVGTWAGNWECEVEIYMDNGERIEGRCDIGGGYTQKITGRYTEPNWISTTVTRTGPDNCTTRVTGNIAVSDRNQAIFNQTGWDGCGVSTRGDAQILARQ